MADVGILQIFLTAAQGEGRQGDPPVLQVISEGFLVQVAEVLHAQLFEWNQHVAEGAVQQLYRGWIRCVR
ncbi:hypothetical protein D3C77_658110 [compost metagenome]